MKLIRQTQPTAPVALTGLYAKARSPLVLLPSVYGMRNPYGAGGSWYFSATYAGTVETRIVEGALRLYADFGGLNDDSLSSEFPVDTAHEFSATQGVLTTIIRFKPYRHSGDAGNYTQAVLTTSSAIDRAGCGHTVSIDSSGNFQTGVSMGNAYERYGTCTPRIATHDQWHTAVISSRPGKDPSISVDGGSCPTLNGQEYYVGSQYGHTDPSSIIKIGHSASYPEYYHYNGLIALVAILPGVYIMQDEAQRLSVNPWQIFEPDTRKIFLPPAVTSTTKRWHPTPVTRTTQPVGVPELDRSNPLTTGLNMLVVPWVNDGQLKLWDLINKRWATVAENNAVHSIVRTKSGVGADNNDLNDNLGGGWVTNVPANTILSSLIVASHRNNGTTRGPVLVDDYGNYFGFPSGTPRLMCNGTLTGSASVWPQNVVTNLAARSQLTKYAVAQDGQITGTYAGSDWPALGPGTAGARICGLGAGYNYYPVTCYLAAGWNRYLSDSELCDVTANPWQLFKPDSRIAWFDHQAGGSPYPVLSLAQLVSILETQATPRVTITVP
jgi:hypothetical protein